MIPISLICWMEEANTFLSAAISFLNFLGDRTTPLESSIPKVMPQSRLLEPKAGLALQQSVVPGVQIPITASE